MGKYTKVSLAVNASINFTLDCCLFDNGAGIVSGHAIIPLGFFSRNNKMTTR